MHYFLCGFMGAGKSTTLRKIEESNKYPNHTFIDLDDWIFEKYKNSENHLGELIMAKGFEWFRKTEFNELQRIWKGDDSWVALGGGSLTQAVTDLIESNDRIKGYWLNTNFELCFERIQNSKERPLANMDKDQLEALYLDRVKSYSNYDEILNF